MISSFCLWSAGHGRVGLCQSQKNGPVDICALNTQQLKTISYTSYNNTVKNYASSAVDPETFDTDLESEDRVPA